MLMNINVDEIQKKKEEKKVSEKYKYTNKIKQIYIHFITQ